MIFIYEGNTGQGKTYLTAVNMLRLLERNKIWFEKKKIQRRRILYTNMAVSPMIVSKYKDYIYYWSDLEQLVKARDSDVIIDDIASYLDAQRWNDLPMSVKRWLRLHEHYGCDIYGNAQDFTTIDISMRRLITQVWHVKKLIGSRRPSATKPEVNHVWGILVIREVSSQDLVIERTQRIYSGIPTVEFIRKKYCQVFDTTQDIQISDYPSLHHIDRSCEVCGKVITRHL